MSERREVYYPKNLLTRSSAKTIKGEKLGWDTHILYLVPHKQNSLGKNLCPNATAGCAAACLYTSGRGKFNSVQKARHNKTDLFLKSKEWFMNKLYSELQLINNRNANSFIGGNKQCVRLNGTSDIPWENLKIRGKNLFEHFPHLQFYDYTKSKNRMYSNKHANYHLTFSRSESNDNDCVEVLDKGHNVAAVFNKDFYKRNLYDGGTALYSFSYTKQYEVLDGDQHDLRFLDEKGGFIVGLKAKADANKDKTGFVI